MDPLNVFLASIFLALYRDWSTEEDRKRAVAFVRDRALRWGPVYAARMAEQWPDPEAVLEAMWISEQLEAGQSHLDDDWAEAHHHLDGKDEELFRRLVAAYIQGGRQHVTDLVRYGEAAGAVRLRSPLGDELPFVTSPFGYRKHPVTNKPHVFHEGIDLRAAFGTPVLAPADGVVGWVEDSPTCGWGMEILHSPTCRTVYCHLSRRDVKTGDRVRAGQVVALTGGRAGHPGAGSSTSSHLHFVVYTRPTPDAKWKATDPVPLVSAAPPAAAEETWSEWLASFWPFSEEEGPTPSTTSGPMAMVEASPGAEPTLVAPDGTMFFAGPVPAGRYELRMSGRPPQQVELEANRTYRTSSIGGLFEVPG